jgi:serine/threonine protein kinase
MDAPAEVADYTITGTVGDGAHGTFFLAAPPARLGDVGTQVVLKLVAGGDADAFRRFTRELRLFNRVQHRGLVQLFDAGQHEDWFFYSMEWCAGGTLAAPAVPLDHRGKIRAVAQVARAAHALHEQGIAHRDIRPGNVMLRGTDPTDVDACLADLGLAQLGGGSVTSMAPLASIGSIDPGVLLGENAGRATDIYSLGAVLHWSLTGQHLHPVETGGDAMLAVRAILRSAPNVRRDLLTGDEADVIAACVDRDVARRPATAAEVATLIEGLADSPTAPAPAADAPAASPFAPPAVSPGTPPGAPAPEDR